MIRNGLQRITEHVQDRWLADSQAVHTSIDLLAGLCSQVVSWPQRVGRWQTRTCNQNALLAISICIYVYRLSWQRSTIHTGYHHAFGSICQEQESTEYCCAMHKYYRHMHELASGCRSPDMGPV